MRKVLMKGVKKATKSMDKSVKRLMEERQNQNEKQAKSFKQLAEELDMDWRKQAAHLGKKANAAISADAEAQVLTKKKLAEFGGEVRKSAKRVEWAVNEVKTRGVAFDLVLERARRKLVLSIQRLAERKKADLKAFLGLQQKIVDGVQPEVVQWVTDSSGRLSESLAKSTDDGSMQILGRLQQLLEHLEDAVKASKVAKSAGVQMDVA